MTQVSIQIPGFRVTAVGALGVAVFLGFLRVVWCGHQIDVRLA